MKDKLYESIDKKWNTFLNERGFFDKFKKAKDNIQFDAEEMKAIKSVVTGAKIKEYGAGKIYWDKSHYDDVEDEKMLDRWVIWKNPARGGFQYTGLTAIRMDRIDDGWYYRPEHTSTKLSQPNVNELKKFIRRL